MTSKFDRSFDLKGLTVDVLKRESWLVDLLALWTPAGSGSDPAGTDSDPRLRLAIRRGYLNFYLAGQSMAEVGFDQHGAIRARIHNKYIYGEKGKGQKYVTLKQGSFPDLDGTLVPYRGQSHLQEWMANAANKTGEEKKFVDRIVGANPNVIDLEMALPNDSDARKSTAETDGEGIALSAPRMDLVVLEPAAGWWRIAFWEAKLVTNKEARCNPPAKPPVVGQLKRYTDWLQKGDHAVQVTGAYQQACRLLIAFHRIAEGINPSIGKLGEGILAVGAADAPRPVLDDKPRILIDDRHHNKSFTENGHLRRLREEFKIHIQMVQEDSHFQLEIPD